MNQVFIDFLVTLLLFLQTVIMYSMNIENFIKNDGERSIFENYYKSRFTIENNVKAKHL